MEIIQSWDATPLIGERPYEKLLYAPNGLEDTAPPSMLRFQDALSQRRDYATRCIDRNAMADGLRVSHERRGAPASAFESIERLKQEDCFLIVTGQQPGFFGGPLFTYYKILHAVSLAKRLSRERAETYIPALWNASEDHDFPEIALVQWLSKDRDTALYVWQGDPQNRRPYFSMSMNDCPVGEMLQRLRDTTHPTEFSEPLLARIEDCAKNAESYPDFFDRLMWTLFPDDGLVILRPDDAWLRRKAVPLIEREIQNPQQSAAGVERIGEVLQQRGLIQQIHKRSDRTSFFLIENGERRPVYIADGGFSLDDGSVYSEADLLRRLEERPDDFSSSAVLRPVVQDALLPTVAAVLGPSEIAYHFLLDDIYKMHGVARPCLVPRNGFTSIDGREAILMERYGLRPADLSEHPAALVKRIVKDGSEGEWADEKESARRVIEALFQNWKEQAQQADPTAIKVLDKNFARIQKELEQSEALLVRKMGEKNKQALKHIEGLCCSLYPNGTLQERQYNIFPYLMKYGPELLTNFKQICETLEDGAHEIVRIP